MEKIAHLKHSKETLFFSLSRMFERGAYYGFRALVVLYMTGEVLKMEASEALEVYGWISASLIFAQVFGALLGDLIIGNKRSIIIGGTIQSLGAFTLCIPDVNALYVGLFLIVLGNGLYTPNIIANFGKSYLSRPKLLDSGFTILYFALNLGAFLGALYLTLISDSYGYQIGFAVAGFITLISIVPVFGTKAKYAVSKPETPLVNRILIIAAIIIIVGIFWGVYEIASIRIFDIQLKLQEISSLNISNTVFQSLGSGFTIAISLIAILIWTFFYYSQYLKLFVGFLFAAMAFGILFFIPEAVQEDHAYYYLISLVLLGISEVHIQPIVHSTLTKYSNPKYLAILVSLAFVPTRVFSMIIGLFNEIFYENSRLGVLIGIIAMTMIGIGLLIYLIVDRKKI